MDKAGSSQDPNIAQTSMALMAQHDQRFNNLLKRFGMRKRDKTGGTRAVLPFNFT
jgi:hypothetical protein